MEITLHEDIIESKYKSHKHEHLHHFNIGGHLQGAGYSQEPRLKKNCHESMYIS